MNQPGTGKVQRKGKINGGTKSMALIVNWSHSTSSVNIHYQSIVIIILYIMQTFIIVTNNMSGEPLYLHWREIFNVCRTHDDTLYIII